MILKKNIQMQEKILDRKLTEKELLETMYALLQAQDSLGLLTRQTANEIIDDYLEYRRTL